MDTHDKNYGRYVYKKVQKLMRKIKDLNMWGDMSCSWIKTPNNLKISSLQIDLYIYCNPIQNFKMNVIENYKLNMKFIWKCEAHRTSSHTLKNKPNHNSRKKNLFLLHCLLKPFSDCVYHNKLCKILQKMGIPDHITTC